MYTCRFHSSPFHHGFTVAWNGDKVKSHCQTREKTEAILAACYPLNNLLTPSIIHSRLDAKIEISSSTVSTCIVMTQPKVQNTSLSSLFAWFTPKKITGQNAQTRGGRLSSHWSP